MGQDKVSGKISKTSLTRRTVLSGAAAMGLSTVARAHGGGYPLPVAANRIMSALIVAVYRTLRLRRRLGGATR